MLTWNPVVHAKAASTEPAPGDVVVSNRRASVEHDVIMVPNRLLQACGTCAQALALAQELARQRHVSLWLTQDQTTYVLLGSWGGPAFASART